MSGGTLVVVPTPVGNLGDMTPRALEVLQEAHLVLAEDTRTTGKLLRHFGVDTPLKSFHQHNEHRALEGVIGQLQGGVTMALCSDAGTPGISDPGFLLVRACVDAGVKVECLPGATAFVPALVTSGLPCDRFYFEGFPASQKGPSETAFGLVGDAVHRGALRESPSRGQTARPTRQLGAGDRPVALCREISKLHEETLRGTVQGLKTILDTQPPRGEYVVVLGAADQNTTR